jgi:hypothetical protein
VTVVTFETGPYTYRGTAFTAAAVVTGVGGLNQSVPVVMSGDCTNVTSANGCTATATFAGDTNHSGSSDTKSITITGATATCTVAGYAETYTGSAYTAAGSCTGLDEGKLPAADLNLSGTTRTNSGTYNGDAWSFSDPNYVSQNGTVNDSIAKGGLTVTASNANKVQGSDNPSFTAGITGFVNGEDASVVSGLVCTSAATASSSIGTYDITCGGATATNYTFTYAKGTLSVVAGRLDHITVTPDPATIPAGTTQAYIANGYDSNNNLIGDYTSSTVFTIDGTHSSCTAEKCGSTIVATYTVTGTYTVPDTTTKLTDTATLNVIAGALDHIVISPSPKTIVAGTTQAYTAEGFDAYGNSLGDVTGKTTFTINGNGSSCTAAACGSTIVGTYTVTGTDSGKKATATLNVTAGALDHIVISPDPKTIVAGATQAYTAEGFDAFGNSLGDVTGSTTFSTSGGASCTGTACGSSTVGDYTITGTFGQLMDGATLHVVAVAAAPTPTPTPTLAPTPAPTPTVAPTEQIEGATATPFISPTPAPTEMVEGATAVPVRSATPPVTSSKSDAPLGGSTPIFGLLICLAFGALGLLAVTAQRRSVRR